MNVRWTTAVLVFCAAAAALFWPMSYQASPRWDVVVIDSDGQPLSGIPVILSYQNYSAERGSHQITLKTDDNGHALFLPQRGRATVIQRVFYTASSAMAGVHASFGPHAWVSTSGSGYQGFAVTGEYLTDWRGSPESMSSQIVVKRQ